MIVTINNNERYESLEYEPADYSVSVLKEYTGTYYSPELDTDYRLSIMEEDLVASHLRTGDVTLTGSKGERFSGNRWYMSEVIFQRNDDGEVNGFLMSSGRVRNLKFVRIQE